MHADVNLFVSPQQIHAVIAASVSIKSSQKLKKILEVSEPLVSRLNSTLSGCVVSLFPVCFCPVVQIILALGNYMNSSKRGAVYGFKLQSLDLVSRVHLTAAPPFVSLTRLTVPSVSLQLLDTKSTDRKTTLLHYIANVVKEKYSQVSLFYNEVHYVDKAAAGEPSATCFLQSTDSCCTY